VTKSSAIPPVGSTARPALTAMETYYLRVLAHWYRFKRAAPSLADLVDLCRRSGPPPGARGPQTRGRGWPTRRPIYVALCACENKGYVRRNNEGKFEVIR
jgi:hypothetical protein